MQETIDFAKNLRSDWCTFHIAAPLRGTEMYQQFVDRGHIADDVATWSTAFFQERSFDTPEIGGEELKELFYRANLEVNFLNNPNLLEGNYEKALHIYKDIVHSYQFHIIGWYCMMLCYEAMGDTLEKENLEEKIINLVKNDPRAQQLYFKYHDLLPKIKITLDHSDEILNRNANAIESNDFLSEDALGEDFLSSQ
ncbi:hypothetical protein OAR29_06480, partial [Rhodospirillales bacterium]|nr:hypothetical protein [Rhodospirillales bacterium]